MSEENTATEENTAKVAHEAQEAEQNPEQPDVPDSFRKELEEARREAARYRVERNELRKDAEAWRKQQDAEKTELQKAQEKLANRDKEYAALEADVLRLRLAAKYGIAEENQDLLGSGSQEELEDRAKRLAAMQKEQMRPPSNTPVEKPVTACVAPLLA